MNRGTALNSDPALIAKKSRESPTRILQSRTVRLRCGFSALSPTISAVFMRYLAILLSLMFIPVAVAAEHPTWTNLARLYGQSKDSKIVGAFVREYQLDEMTKGPSGSFTSDDYAYSIHYRENRVTTIILKITPPIGGYAQENWRSYSGALPYELAARDGRSDIVKKLGAPVEPGGEVWNHDGLDIWVFFNKDESGINELYISPLNDQKKP